MSHNNINVKDINALRDIELGLINSRDIEGASDVRDIIYSLKANHVEVDEQRNVLMCDSIKQDNRGEYYIVAGSMVYSGMTGNLLFTVRCNLKYPFDVNTLKRSINNMGLIFDDQGVYEHGGVNFIEGQQVEFMQSVRY